MTTKKTRPAGPAVIKYNIRFTPLPTDPKGASEFYYSLGVLMVAWGRLEGHFTLTLLNLMRMAGATVVTHKLPISWKARCGIWRKAFKSIHELKPLEDKANQLLDKIIDTAQDRHILLHANWEDFHQNDPKRIDVISLKHEKSSQDGLQFQRITITLDMLKTITKNINAHNKQLYEISALVSSYSPAPKNARPI